MCHLQGAIQQIRRLQVPYEGVVPKADAEHQGGETGGGVNGRELDHNQGQQWRTHFGQWASRGRDRTQSLHHVDASRSYLLAGRH